MIDVRQNQANSAPVMGQDNIEPDVREWLDRNGFVVSRPGLYMAEYTDRVGGRRRCYVRFDKKHPGGALLVQYEDELLALEDLVEEDRPEPLLRFKLFMEQRSADKSAEAASIGERGGRQGPSPAPPRIPAPVAPSAAKPVGIAQRIKSVAEVETNLTVLVYGRSGTGKTTFASSFPKPMLIVDIGEKGTIGLKNVGGIDVLEAENWADVQGLLEYLRAGHKYQTIVLDTVTGLQDLATLEVMRRYNMRPEDKLTLPQHGVVAQMMINMLQSYRCVAPYVLFLAQDRENRPGEEEEHVDQIDPYVGPELKDKVAKTLCRMVSVAVQTMIREEAGRGPDGKVVMRPVYRLRVGPHPVYYTKIRQEQGRPVPPDIEPTYKALVAVMTPPKEEGR